jgi:hypothetical protein
MAERFHRYYDLRLTTFNIYYLENAVLLDIVQGKMHG